MHHFDIACKRVIYTSLQCPSNCYMTTLSIAKQYLQGLKLHVMVLT